jgi:hypothetical protein
MDYDEQMLDDIGDNNYNNIMHHWKTLVWEYLQIIW